MTCIVHSNSLRPALAKRFVLLAFSAVVLIGTVVTSARAEDHRGGDRRGDDRRGGDRRGGGPGFYRGGPGYYPPPPVIYGGGPYYPPPPVVYAPGVGINLPGISINVR